MLLVIFCQFIRTLAITHCVICNTYLVLEDKNIQSIFILKEASEEQLKSLVVGSKQGKIADEELEKLISKQSISKNQAKLKGRREKLLPLIFLFLKSKGTDAFGTRLRHPFNAPIASCLKPLF